MSGVARPTAVARLRAGRVEYRLERHGDATIVVCHGGHVRAGLALGEEVFTDAGYTVLVPSRPGYGRTPIEVGRSPSGFADVIRALCTQLGIDRVAAVVGISAGGRTAVTLAARHPALVERLILQSAVSFRPWPDRRTRLAAHVGFNAVTEPATWGVVRTLMRRAPTVGLRLLLRELTTERSGPVVAALSAHDRATLITLFSRMRSGRGFLNDLRRTPDVTAQVRQPALVIASRKDGAVPFAHAEALVASLPYAALVESRAPSHFIWFAPDYPLIADTMRGFLSADGGTRR